MKPNDTSTKLSMITILWYFRFNTKNPHEVFRRDRLPYCTTKQLQGIDLPKLGIQIAHIRFRCDL